MYSVLSNQGFVVLFTFFCRFKMLSTVIYSTFFIDCVFSVLQSVNLVLEGKRQKIKLWRKGRKLNDVILVLVFKKKEQATKETQTIQFFIDYVYVPFIDTGYETWLIHTLFPLMNLIDFGGTFWPYCLSRNKCDRHVIKMRDYLCAFNEFTSSDKTKRKYTIAFMLRNHSL